MEPLKRIGELVIPPAWEDVWICREPHGHLQATGRDEKRRKQYIYHAGWEEVRNRTKFHTLLQFAEALPRIRAAVRRDLRRQDLSRRNVLALAVRILDQTLIRVGNEFYADLNRSYGLTTLRDRHMDVEQDAAAFRFRGKSGREQEVVLDDPRLVELASGRPQSAIVKEAIEKDLGDPERPFLKLAGAAEGASTLSQRKGFSTS